MKPRLKVVSTSESEYGSVEIPRKILQETLQRFAKSEETAREDMYLRSKLAEYETSSRTCRQQPDSDPALEDVSVNT